MSTSLEWNVQELIGTSLEWNIQELRVAYVHHTIAH